MDLVRRLRRRQDTNHGLSLTEQEPPASSLCCGSRVIRRLSRYPRSMGSAQGRRLFGASAEGPYS